MRETQKGIFQWATKTFGETKSNLRIAIRANVEMAELLDALAMSDNHSQLGEELADVIITLSTLGERSGINIQNEIDKKMALNRLRTWKVDGSGCGYHVDEEDRTSVDSKQEKVSPNVAWPGLLLKHGKRDGPAVNPFPRGQLINERLFDSEFMGFHLSEGKHSLLASMILVLLVAGLGIAILACILLFIAPALGGAQ